MAHTGVVKKYNSDKGFGFIVPQGTNQDLFVLRTDVLGGSLQAGDKVNFDEGFNERTGKPKAVNVTGGTGPVGKGEGEGGGGKGKGKRGDKGKGGPKQLPGLAGLNGGLAVGPLPGSPMPCGPCGPCAGGCGLPGAGKPMAMPGAGGAKTGLVKFFNDEKGFGFIKQDDGGTDLFVHRNDVIDQLLKEGDRVSYSEAVDSRTGRMKAHQVSGGTGGAKPPEKGKGKGKKGKGKAQSPGLEAPPMPSLDTGAMGAMGNAKMSSLAAQFGCGAAGNAGVLMGKPGFGDGAPTMPDVGCMAGGGCTGCGLCGCGGCGCSGCQPCGCGNLPMGSCGCGGGCGCGGNCGVPQNLNAAGAGCGGCCGACCGCNPCGACGCGACGCGACGCGACGGCGGCGGNCFGNAAGGGNTQDVSQLGAMYQRLANAGANAGAGATGFDHDFDYGGQGGTQTLAARAAAGCFANLAGAGGALGATGNQGMAGMAMTGDTPTVPGGCFGNTDTPGSAAQTINPAMYERLASATAGGNFEDYAEYGGQGAGNLARAGAGGVAFTNLGGSANMLPSVSNPAGGNLLGAGANQGGMPNQMTMANMQAMAAMGQPGMYQMGNPTGLPTGNVSHGNL